LRADLPSHIGALMAVSGVGPRMAQRLHETLGIQTPDDWVHAASAGRVQEVWGVGPKRASQWAQLSLFGDAEPAALELFSAGAELQEDDDVMPWDRKMAA
jgi:DNA polymerase/3'-5' exonuclease PolX